MGLRYFGLRVTNLERSLDFHTELLGLGVRRRGKMYHGGKRVLLGDPRTHQRLELNWYPEDSPYVNKYEPGESLDHIGFAVSNPASTFKELIKAGVEPALAPGDKNGVRGVYYVKDPDENWIEFF